MDMLLSIVRVCQDMYFADKLVPQKFPTPESLIKSLGEFKGMLQEFQPYLDINKSENDTPTIVEDLKRIKDELIQMIDYVKTIYDYEDTVIPYQQLRYNLIVGNIAGFIGILKSILASVSYDIKKTREDYFHSNVFLVLKLLGFDILAEESTSLGRIDATIRFADTIYILEFKFNESKDMSTIALQQIKDNRYAQKFLYENKNIILMGISFSDKDKNINGYLHETFEGN